MTIGYWVFVAFVAAVGLGFTIYQFSEDTTHGIISLFVTMFVVGAIISGGTWYYNNTATGLRALKDQQSNLSNGIEREIIITAEDGREIYYYRGKCDIETNDNYILFEDENGNRQMIYWGITDTIIISEIGD